MAQTIVYEGTGEELIPHLKALPQQRFRLIALSAGNAAEPTTPIVPNEKALAALREIAERQKHRPYTNGSDTIRLLHEAREGAMYDYAPDK